MYNCGLILEGGGMRGVYTAGIIDYFLEMGILCILDIVNFYIF